MAFSYKRPINLDHTQVPSGQSNYPAVVKLDATNAGTTMKTVGNGGHIQNTGTQSGGVPVVMPFDLIFTSDSGGTTKIPWEVENYDPVAGLLWVHVKIASISSSVDTVIYMFYGDSSVNTQQNTSSFAPSNVWDANFIGVWHLCDNSGLLATDSTSNGLTGTISGAVSGGGQIDGGANFNGSQNINMGSHAILMPTIAVTIEAWVNPNSNSQNTYSAIAAQGYSAPRGSPFWAYKLGMAHAASPSNYNMETDIPGFDDSLDSGVAFVSGTWASLAGTLTSGSQIIYVNGAAKTTQTNTGSIAYGSNGQFLLGQNSDPAEGANALIDEVRVSNIVRSADWLVTCYNNQNNPESFSVVGSEIANAIIGPFPTHISS